MCKNFALCRFLKSFYRLPHTIQAVLLLTAFTSKLDQDLPFQPIHKRPQRIALLLPFSKEHHTISRAIETGFSEANVASDYPLSIKVIDTSKDASIKNSYQTAMQWNADLLVGPLLKADVKKITELSTLKVPVLTLNYLRQRQKAPANVYQFGLSPLDEINTILKDAGKKQHQSALVIVPKDDWGKELAEHFTQQWKSQGGKVAGTLNYSNKIPTLNYQIRQFLDFSPPNHRRCDFDFIFIAANAAMGHQIKPLLAFYFACNTPIYATAATYDASLPNYLKRDLDDMIIADAPWNAGIKTLYPNIQAQCIKKSQSLFKHYARYYALGVDAFLLATHLTALDENTDQVLQGATGELHVNQDRHIVRKPICAKLKQGDLQLLSTEYPENFETLQSN